MSHGNSQLNNALRALAAESAGAGAPERLRGKLQAELRARARKRRLAALWPVGLAVAAALVIGVWIGRSHPATPASDLQTAAITQPQPLPATAAETVSETAPDLPAPLPATTPRARLVRSAPARTAPPATPWFFYNAAPLAEKGHVVPITVPAATAAQFGVFRGTDTVPAQLFIGDDGMVRAIRFVR